MTRVFGRFVRNPLLPVAVFTIVLSAGVAAYADPQQDVSRLFEMHSRLKPGMTIEAINEMLGPPAESHTLGKNAPDVTRYVWLHGEMGIEAYEVESVAYRVTITLPCGNSKNLLRALDALSRQGKLKYGSDALDDPGKNEYYWVRDGIRFAFSRYDPKTTVLKSSSTKAH